MIRKVAFVYGTRGRTGASGTPYYFARALEAFGKRTNSFDEIDVVPKRFRKVLPTYLRWCLQSRSTRFQLFWQSQACVDSSARDMVVAENIQPYFIVWGTTCPVQHAGLSPHASRRPDHRVYRHNVPLLSPAQPTNLLNPPRGVRERMIRDEKNGYAQADLIAVFHEGVRAQMIRDYDVPPEKVWVIGRGVNLERELLDRLATQQRSDLYG